MAAIPASIRAEHERLRCCFCGKDADAVRFLSAGVAGGMICDRCCFQAFVIFMKARLGQALRLGAS